VAVTLGIGAVLGVGLALDGRLEVSGDGVVDVEPPGAVIAISAQPAARNIAMDESRMRRRAGTTDHPTLTEGVDRTFLPTARNG
jgi:hypothetical protein